MDWKAGSLKVSNVEGGGKVHAGDARSATKYRFPDGPEIVVRAGEESSAVESMRRLKSYLADPALEPNQVILVTSPIPGDGKSFIALNLALAFASDRKSETVLVDGDLRRPGTSATILPRPPYGLGAVLEDKATLEQSLVKIDNHPLWVLPSRRPEEDGLPLQDLPHDRLAETIGELRRRFNRIILDTPPLIPFSDSIVASAVADGVLLVVRSGQTPKALFNEAVEMLGETRVFGVVLNGAQYSFADSNRDYEYYRRSYYKRGTGSD